MLDEAGNCITLPLKHPPTHVLDRAGPYSIAASTTIYSFLHTKWGFLSFNRRPWFSVPPGPAREEPGTKMVDAEERAQPAEPSGSASVFSGRS
jgi:hypothetical protein